MKCVDCKNFRKPRAIVEGIPGFCTWHDAELAHDVVEMDSAEKDCLGFEAKV